MDRNLDIITEMREFNRFYTQILGLLDQHILNSGYSLTEARVLFELSKTENCTANMLINQFRIDPSYMSRIISKFERKSLISKEISKIDSRVKCINLTEYGTTVVDGLIEKSNEQIGNLLAPLSIDGSKQVQDAMKTIKKYLAASCKKSVDSKI